DAAGFDVAAQGAFPDPQVLGGLASGEHPLFRCRLHATGSGALMIAVSGTLRAEAMSTSCRSVPTRWPDSMRERFVLSMRAAAARSVIDSPVRSRIALIACPFACTQ